jgi:hypothetical protein
MLAIDAGEVQLLANKGHYTATASTVVDEACVNGRGADEGIATVEGVLKRFFGICRPTNDQWLVVDFLISNRVRIHNFDALAICWTPESHGTIFKRSTKVAVEATSIGIAPVWLLALLANIVSTVMLTKTYRCISL